MTVEAFVVDLLTDRHPAKARDLILSWVERRSASWADAAREAEARAASGGHLPQIRGQLRYHFGERSLADAAHDVSVGVLPFRTVPPGGVFMVARIGRFALVNLTARSPAVMPRRSATRKMLSEPNEAIDPQSSLDLGDKSRVVTELAYFGCLVTVPSDKDPTAPSLLALGVPNATLTRWVAWISSHRLHAMLQERVDSTATRGEPSGGTIPDLAFPRFRLPKGDTKDESEPA